MYVTGTITQVLPILKHQTPNGTIVSQSFIFRDDRGNDALFVIPDEKRVRLYNINVGDKVTVHFNIVAKERNGAWYNNLYVWKIGEPRIYTNVMKDIKLTPTKKREWEKRS